jgi:RNA polymerase sigma-70 factor, ECF subfamily
MPTTGSRKLRWLNPMDHFEKLSDEELAAIASDGSEAAFAVLVDRYTHPVYRLAYGITGIAQESEDIVQETFIKAFSHIETYSPSKAAFKTWLLTIARNQSINVFSSLKRKALRFLNELDADENRGRSDNPFSASPHDVENLLSMKQEVFRVEEALKSLPERQRTAVLLKAKESMSYDEIARIMNTSSSSVESLIFRARKRLMEILDD